MLFLRTQRLANRGHRGMIMDFVDRIDNLVLLMYNLNSLFLMDILTISHGTRESRQIWTHVHFS